MTGSEKRRLRPPARLQNRSLRLFEWLWKRGSGLYEWLRFWGAA